MYKGAVPLLVIIFLHVVSMYSVVLSDVRTSCLKLVLEEQSLVSNRSNKTFNISEMPMVLYFEYPQDIGGQKLLKIEVYWNATPANYSVVQSRDGDKSLRVRPLSLFIRPGDTLNITVRYMLMLNSTERRIWQPRFNASRGLGETSLWNYSNPLVHQAYGLMDRHASSDLDYLQEVLYWLDSKIAYSSRVPARYPWEVLEERAGDCDDRSNLLVSLLRARGVPAYTEFGFIVIPGYVSEGSAADGHFTYRILNGGPHGWVRTYINSKWIVVDTTFYRNATGSAMDHVTYSAYNMEGLPVVVTGWVLNTDYIGRDTRTLQEIISTEIYINETMRASIIDGCS